MMKSIKKLALTRAVVTVMMSFAAPAMAAQVGGPENCGCTNTSNIMQANGEYKA